MEFITYSETGNLFLSGEEEGKIRSKHYPKIISNINMALIELHKRFPVSVKVLTVQQYTHISNYILTRDYAWSNTASTQTYKYIIDSVTSPYNNDLLKIERVHAEECEDSCGQNDFREFPLNDENEPWSLFTPSYNILQIPFPIAENAVFVEYRAYPEKIPVNTTDIESVEVNFPEILLEPLLCYMNYKLYTAVGTEKQESGLYMQRYEVECQKIDQLGVYNRDTMLNLKLETREWV